jgi:RHS repeat-associated protein
MSALAKRRTRRSRTWSYRLLVEALERRLVPSLLGLAPEGVRPDITSGILNNLSYTQVGNNANPFHYDSIPLWITMPDGSVDYISDPSNGSMATTSLDVTLDNTGALAAGNANNNPFRVTGQVTIGANTYDGTLLTAQATAFGFADSFSADSGEFEVNLVITGGQLAAAVNAAPNPFRIGDTLGLLIHQPDLTITSFPNTFSFSWMDGGIFDGMSDAVNIPAQSTNQNYGPQFNMGCGRLTVDPLQGSVTAFGTAWIAAQNGNVQIQQALDFRHSVPTCSCGCVGESGNAPQGQTGASGEVQTDNNADPLPALVYNSETVGVRPIIQGTYYTDTYGSVPTQIQVQLTWNGTPQPAVTYSTAGHNPGDTYALAVQVSTPVTTTGVYPWQLQITATFSDGSVLTQVCSGSAAVVANDTSPYGAGWSLAGVDQLVPVTGGVLWVYGSGGSRFFTKGPGNTFVSPANDFGTLVQNGDGSFTYTAKDQIQTHFDSQGREVTQTDPHNLTVTYTYDGAGRLTGVAKPDGGVTTFTYDSSGHLRNIDEPGGRVLTFTYDAAGDLITVTDPAGELRTFTYDANHHLTNDHWGTQDTTYTYDATGGVSSVDRGGGDTLAISPADVQALQTSPAASLSQVVATEADGLGRVTTYTYDSQGREVREDQPMGVSQSYQYDVHGQVVATTDPLDHMSFYSYQYGSGLGDRVESVYADGSTARYQFDPTYHEMTRYQDPLDDVTTYTYDPGTGDLLTMTNPLFGVTFYTWSAGLLQSMTDANGHATHYQYDSDRRLTVMTDPLGKRTTYTYDPAGNPATIQDRLGRVTTYAYDADRRLVNQTDAAGGVTTMTYNAQDQVTSQTDALGRVTQYTYDARGRLTALTEAVGTPQQRTTSYSYDAVGNQTGQTDPRGFSTSYAYDALNRHTSVTEAVGTPQQRTTTTVYDPAGNVTETIDALGRVTTYSYDARNRQTAMTEAVGTPQQRTTTTTYDAEGNVRSTTDARGFTTSYAYDGLNREVSTTEAVGTPQQRTTTTTYDAVGNVTQVIDPRGIVTSYAYDADNRRTGETDVVGTPQQRTTTTTYDPDGNVIQTMDPLGRVTSFAYDVLNRQTGRTDAVGTPQQRTTTTTYDAVGNVTSHTDTLGRVTTFAYDALNRRTGETDAVGTPLQRTTTTVYDPDNNITRTIDALGNTTTYTFDALDRRTTVTDPLGRTTTTVYDAADNVISVTDPRGFSTTDSYDALDRLVRTADALGDVTTTVYDATDNVIQTIDPRGNTTTYSYDALNRQTAVTVPLGHTTTSTYDPDDNVISRTDPLGRVTTYTYDALNRPVTTQDPNGAVTTTTYDAVDNVISTIDPLGHTTSNAYDALNRQVTTTDALGKVTTFTYDAVSNRTAVIDPDGNTTTSVYDALNREVQRIDPFGKSTTMTYDADSRLVSRRDRDGRTIQYSYDAAGQLTGEVWKDSGNTVVNTVTYTYDADGNKLIAADVHSAYTMTYDAVDRVASVQEPFGLTLTYSYDAAGNRVKVQDSAGGTQTMIYDDANRLTTTEFDNGTTRLRLDMTDDAANEKLTETRYSDLTGTNKVGSSAFTYDGDGRVLTVQYRNGGGGSLANYTYTYDAAGRLTTETIDGANRTYTFDADNQLTSDNGTATYTYDANGNRTNGGNVTGTGNRLTTDGTWNFLYDQEGNVVQKTRIATGEYWTYAYDNLNRLTAAVDHNSSNTVLETVTYTYDVLGNRIEEDVKVDSGPTAVTRFAYDGPNAWADLDGSNTLLSRRLSLGVVDQVFARIGAGGGAAWYLTDRLNSIRAVTDATGALQDRITYDAFGNVLTETNPAFGDRYKYTGREFDSATGLQYNRARYYDATIGRWLSEDPLGFDGGDTNLYRYVHNNPLARTDPSGEAPAVGAASQQITLLADIPPLAEGPYGAVAWLALWRVRPQTCEGEIVQILESKFRITKGQRVLFSRAYTYAEAWEVSGGKAEPAQIWQNTNETDLVDAQVTTPIPADTEFNDHWLFYIRRADAAVRRAAQRDTVGDFEWNAEAIYYPELTDRDLRALGFTSPMEIQGERPAGVLLARNLERWPVAVALERFLDARLQHSNTFERYLSDKWDSTGATNVAFLASTTISNPPAPSSLLPRPPGGR